MGLGDGLKSVLNTFLNWLPESANRQTSEDMGNVAKSSPWLFDYDVFKLNWEKVDVLKDIDHMLRSDPRLRRANRIFASTAIRRGVTVKLSSEVNETIADQAQQIIEELIRMVQLNSKLQPWARSLLKDGELFLNPIIDAKTRKIIDIKNLPAMTMQRNENIKGRFDDLNDAFRQIDPVSREVLQKFPLWSINHIRHEHEAGALYGQSQYMSCRAIWRKLEMLEQDMVVRRRTRAVPRRLHIVGTKDNPGGWEEVKRYKAFNSLDNPKKSAITTDYFGNGLTDIKDLNGDAQLDHIKDVEYFQELMMLGTGVPLAITGFGQNINRDVLEDQKKQFDEDVQTLRDLLEYGDESANSGLRVIFDLALMLQGIDPELIDYNFMWAETDDETIDDKVDRVIKLRAAQPIPLMSAETAMSYLGRDIGYENQDAVEAEMAKIEEELDKEFEQQQKMATAINPEKPSPMDVNRGTTNTSGKPTKDSVDALNAFVDSRRSKKNFLRSSTVSKWEKQLVDEIREFFKTVYDTWKDDDGLRRAIEKVIKLKDVHNDSVESFVTYIMSDDAVSLMNKHSDCSCSECTPKAITDEVKLNDLVEAHVIVEFEKAWKEHEMSFVNMLISKYGEVGVKAFEQASEVSGVAIDFNFVHSGVKDDLAHDAATRVRGIGETTRQLLAKQLSEAYTNGENVNQWISRIDSVMDIPDWRSEMIARTEISFAFNKANLAAYGEAGVTRVEWMAVMDRRTCPICSGRNGKIYDITSLPAIPAHPRCRCTTNAVFN